MIPAIEYPQRRVLHDDDELEFGYEGFTVAQLQEFMRKADIPEDAVLSYEGCGSHNLMFTWEATPKQRAAILLERQKKEERTAAAERELRERYPNLV